MAELYIGLMSGTSLDGVDGVLVDFSGPRLDVLAHHHLPFPASFSGQLLSLNVSAADELHRGALAANELVRCYAQVVGALLAQSGVPAQAIAAIGAHGQTVRHRPGEFDGTGYSLQINNPALLAELTAITVVADFRSRDVAAGGQGAPLVPAFHAAFFGADGVPCSVLNIGGIANLSALGAPTPDQDRAIIGFDCGPGNALLDCWCQRHTGQPFDRAGAWSRSGAVDQALLSALMAEPYLAQSPPKSTGRDLFNAAWLDRHLANCQAHAVDVQATLCEFTARACAQAVERHAPATQVLIVCGGGAMNADLMRRLQHALPKAAVKTSDAYGLPPLQVEATAFAWLARKAMRHETGSLESVTGARGARILGAIYPR